MAVKPEPKFARFFFLETCFFYLFFPEKKVHSSPLLLNPVKFPGFVDSQGSFRIWIVIDIFYSKLCIMYNNLIYIPFVGLLLHSPHWFSWLCQVFNTANHISTNLCVTCTYTCKGFHVLFSWLSIRSGGSFVWKRRPDGAIRKSFATQHYWGQNHTNRHGIVSKQLLKRNFKSADGCFLSKKPKRLA